MQEDLDDMATESWVVVQIVAFLGSVTFTVILTFFFIAM
jgi:hypothetical protein